MTRKKTPPRTRKAARGGRAGSRGVAPEARERQAAWARGEAAQGGHAEQRDPYSGLASRGIAQRAFATLAENVRDYAVFLLNPQGVITFWGEGARLMKWWTRAQAEGAHLRLLYPDGGSDDGTAEAHIQDAIERGEYTGEGNRIRSDGSTFWAGVTLTALRDEDGTLLGFAKVTRDITARRGADAALKSAHESAEQARRHAEEASRAKSLFLATISHEIRTPLNAIMAYTDIMAMELGGPLTETQHSQLGRIRTSSQHLLGIVEDVLDLSRVEAGRMVVDRRAARIGPVIADAVTLVGPQAAARSIQISDAVSGLAADVPFAGDVERVRQILLNLLSNAVKFTDPGGRITVSAGTANLPSPDAQVEEPGPWVYVRVEDTGRGIPADRIEAVFEPFVQADMNLTRQHGGTGLGLAISRRFARLMGGDLTVRSELGAGSTFFLWLPAAAVELATAQPTGAGGESANQGILRAVREAILTEMERVLYAFVARLRSDAATPSAHSLAEPDLEDHLASFLADVAQTLAGLDLSVGREAGALRDGTLIQRAIAERHGKQRRRLGWLESELRREHEILLEELSAAVRRQVARERQEEVEDAISTLGQFLGSAERISVESFRGAGEALT
ncbi:MAG: PAS domain S-box protein [Gemmatimonadetes bacterium]|nr:PAS domain S-box protein [Gemmatimonadota bacterium]